MVKKSTTTSFSFWDVQDYIRECRNMVRWNPRLAIDWMESISNRIWGELQSRQYNETARYINTYLDNLETYRYYNKRDIWDNDRVRRVALIRDFEDSTS